MLLLSILLLPGCSRSPQAKVLDKLAGNWSLTAADRLMRKLGAESALPADDGESLNEVESPKMLLQFEANGALTTRTKMGRFDAPPKQGTWRLLDWNEAQNRMEIECSISGQATMHEIRFLEPDLIELIPPNLAGTNSWLRFRRID
jgi:hypothetical protein